MNLKRAQVLYLSQDPAGSDQNLLQALSDAQFDVKRDATLLDSDMSAIQLVVLNNLDLQSITPERKKRLEEYVRNGGGLLLIGGEKQMYKDRKQEDALDRVLPGIACSAKES